jgi:hypothetical protein
VRNLRSDTTVLIAKGTYNLTHTLHLTGKLRNVALRGETGRRQDVVLRGLGMTNPNFGNVPHGIMVSDAADVLIADLSVGDVWFHPITLQGPDGCQRVRVHDCRLFDAGQQFLKSNPRSPDGAAGGVDNCVVEYCLFEFTATAKDWYTEGVDVHAGSGWVVRRNLFRNIRGPKGSDRLVGGAIDFWNRSRDTLVEENLIFNCEVGIRFGIVERNGYADHTGGIIRNNFVFRAKGSCDRADVGIIVSDSPGTKVLHNTVMLEDGYPNAIEYRFAGSKGLVVAGNLTNRAIRARDGAQATVKDNVTDAPDEWFVKTADANLHLTPRAREMLRKAETREDCPGDFDGESRGRNGLTAVGADG